MSEMQPSLARVVEQYEQAGQASFTRDSGGQLVVTIARVRGLDIYGTADRYGVVGGMTLFGEVLLDGWKCRIEFLVERAVFDTPETARIQMEALFVTCTPYDPPRRAPRIPVRGVASVRALWCQAVADETVFEALTVALSRDGVVLSTWRYLRPSDRLWLRARLHGVLLEAMLFVDCVHPGGDGPDDLLAECLFVEPSRKVLDTVRRVEAVHEERGGVTLVELDDVRRALVAADISELDRRGLLKRLP